ASTRTGTTSIQNGTVRITDADALGTGTISFASAGVLELSGVNVTRPLALPASTSGSLRGKGSSTYSGTITAATSASLALATSTSSSDTLTVQNYTGGSGSTTHVSGSGTVQLPAAASYAGAWTVDGGTLRLAHDAA